jgi:hypothetical protein
MEPNNSDHEGKKMSNEPEDLRQAIEDLKLAQAVQAAATTGAHATQAAVTAGAHAAQAAATAGLFSTMVTGAAALIVGIFLGFVIRSK